MNRLDYDADPYFEQLRSLRVSAHFLIRRDGEVVQFVSANHRAWHAGTSNFYGQERCNDFSIGVELEGTDDQPFEEAQYVALAALTATLAVAYPLKNVTGHEHIAPGRKTDPGPFFDWAIYQSRYLGLKTGTIKEASASAGLVFRPM
jgi:AmpD protein